MNGKVKTTSSLSLTLVLASMSRAFLSLLCRGIRSVHASSTTYPLAGEGRAWSKELSTMIDGAPVRFNAYEKFLNGVESAIKQAYQGAGFGDNERRTPEKDLLVTSRIPAVLIPAVNSLFKQILPSIQSETDQMAIYLTDYSWLGVCNDRRTEYYRRNQQVDILKKMPLRGFSLSDKNNADIPNTTSGLIANRARPGSLSRRRCARCCEISGDLSSPPSAIYFQIAFRLQIIRNCLCGGTWTLEGSRNST